MKPGLRQALARQPRECRDTLFLLACIAATLIPHAGHLPLWTCALTGLVLFWRGLLAWRGQALPGRWPLVAVLAVSVSLTWLSHHSLIGREPGITLLVMLMALKTLELRARRDAFVVFFLGFFLVLTHFLYSQSLLTALWTLLSVWGLLSALVLAQMPVGQPSLKLAAGLAGRSALAGLPVMVLLFLLFPRIAPLWGLPADSVGRTGLSNRMEMGAMAEIANDDSIAMRLRFEGAPPPPQARYFRGPVLAHFDGRVWRPADLGPAGWPSRSEDLQLRGSPLRYELTLEPLRIKVLPLLEMSPEPAGTTRALDSIALRREPELQWSAPRPITERLRLNAEAYLDYRQGPLTPNLSLQNYLELPAGLNPRSLQWAAELRGQPRFQGLAATDLPPALVQAVLEHIRRSDFIYTLSPGRYGETSPHLIDEFWLDRRLGFCEHFAGAFVVMMRALGIPARVVTGFQGMDALPQDGYWIVRNSNAHAWAEVWLPGRGWQRVDPTAAVAPERIQQGLALQPQAGAIAGALGQLSPTLWRSLRGGWESLNNRWQQVVLNYSRQNQFDLLKRLGVESPDWLALGRLSALLIAGIALAGGLWALWASGALWTRDPWARQRSQLLRRLRRLGLDAQAHQGPREWARLLQERFGAADGKAAAQLLLELERRRYGPPARAQTAGQACARPQRWRERWRWRREFDQALKPLAQAQTSSRALSRP